ncbi:acetyl/propionyl/methylcrotonyl-CoA carboxylase subunit alpha [Tepidicella baoligensis]|uniref:acetyl/propionyl/methylcrotonyl-CoA carboxylase subunit alpha n=1 Tax=Tepidicella baoligensis TaxID=2707016 RepID=UPI0015D9995A|nr:biotin carboxylase N-terminal domain-containing protein [Tepidicella baoligensis]
MFTRLLIANRGEIACRVIRTCRRLGILTVAVYSEADTNARHVREADEAVCIGPAKASQSYLNAAAVIQAAREREVQAIHPGYGFLSERLELVEACEAAGIVFVGPHKRAMAAMGSKIESKRIARRAGVPCVPGYDGDDQSIERLSEEAIRIGFPLLIKASAGGGGKGMRRVEQLEDLKDQLSMAQAEAFAAFGDDKVLLERFIVRPRHVEVQLLGDRHGGLVHLFERECSIQRSYQKLIEEAPAHRLDASVKARLFSAALTLGKQIAYDSAGTVEFVLDADRNDEPYFLEMNTRLQVEHPVTEITTGLDLVEWQIRVAAGEPLAFTQADLHQRGWAIEARVNAESPEDRFAPSFGPVRDYEALASEGVRIDSGIDGASEVTPHYDSMVAKVIGHGATREVARLRLLDGLRKLRIEGLQTTQAMLQDILQTPAFHEVLTTNFLPAIWPNGWKDTSGALAMARRIACAEWLHAHLEPAHTPMQALVGWRVTAAAGGTGRCRVLATDHTGEHELVLQLDAQGATSVFNEEAWHLRRTAPGLWRTPENRSFHCTVEGHAVRIWSDGWSSTVHVTPAVARPAKSVSTHSSDDVVRADMPGVLSQILVGVGQWVQTGEPVAVLEAMKLFHTLYAPRDGEVKALPVAIGDTVAKGAALIEFNPLP